MVTIQITVRTLCYSSKLMCETTINLAQKPTAVGVRTVNSYFGCYSYIPATNLMNDTKPTTIIAAQAVLDAHAIS